jgi:hypothetical protein
LTSWHHPSRSRINTCWVGVSVSNIVVSRYKLSLCHTPIKPNLLGFWGICVFACGLLDRVFKRFASFVIALGDQEKTTFTCLFGTFTYRIMSLDFDIKCVTIQFYSNSHNSQSNRWIELKFYMGSPMMRTSWSHGHTTHKQRHQFLKSQVNQVW